ncbi:hypothetical protein [Mucisphaera sp.]|uniref:hypothetical protein n=1 Tax=Mucisphaera sp. TaxID=2913024 RepID=UPI003D0D4F91
MNDLRLVRVSARQSHTNKKTAIHLGWLVRAHGLLEGVEEEPRRVALRDAFEERAAIACFEGGLSRAEAEKLAFDELVMELMKNV